MNRDDIIVLPHPNLRRRSLKVSGFDDGLEKLYQNMVSAALDWENHRKHELGVALAAVQVNSLLRVVVVRSDFDNKDNHDFLVFVNPKIIRLEGEQVEDFEGCLSVPDIYGKVKRYSKVKIKAHDIDGREFRLTADGFLARVLQHEIDHTEGKLFVDYIKDKRDAFFRLDNDGKLTAVDYDTLDTDSFFR
jgi:peptide deformylase